MMMMVSLKIMMMMMIGNNVCSIAMKLIIEIPLRQKMTSWFLYSWTQMLWLQLIMKMMIVVTYWAVFTVAPNFRYQNDKNLLTKFVGCFALSFFLAKKLWLTDLILKIRRNS